MLVRSFESATKGMLALTEFLDNTAMNLANVNTVGYKKGSLKQTDDGVSFELKNVLGPGFISGFNFVKINDAIFSPDKVKFITQGTEISAESVDEKHPIGFRLGQEGTLILQGAKCLKDGINQIIIELMNPEAGKVKLSLTDSFQFA